MGTWWALDVVVSRFEQPTVVFFHFFLCQRKKCEKAISHSEQCTSALSAPGLITPQGMVPGAPYLWSHLNYISDGQCPRGRRGSILTPWQQWVGAWTGAAWPKGRRSDLARSVPDLGSSTLPGLSRPTELPLSAQFHLPLPACPLPRNGPLLARLTSPGVAVVLLDWCNCLCWPCARSISIKLLYSSFTKALGWCRPYALAQYGPWIAPSAQIVYQNSNYNCQLFHH